MTSNATSKLPQIQAFSFYEGHWATVPILITEIIDAPQYTLIHLQLDAILNASELEMVIIWSNCKCFISMLDSLCIRLYATFFFAFLPFNTTSQKSRQYAQGTEIGGEKNQSCYMSLSFNHGNYQKIYTLHHNVNNQGGTYLKQFVLLTATRNHFQTPKLHKFEVSYLLP